jgi:general secretion pathway protein D
MSKNFITKKLVTFFAVILLSGPFTAGTGVMAVDFDPFGSGEANTPAWEKEGMSNRIIVPQIQFNNNDISMAFQIISDATGWSIFPTAEVSKSKISLWAKNITAMELLDKVVKLAGFLYHRQGDVVTVMTYEEYTQLYGLEKKVIPIRYADAASIDVVSRSFLSKLGKSVVHKETNTIVLFETEANLKVIVGIIEKLDTPVDSAMLIEVIGIKYADAEVLAETLSKIFSTKEPKDNLKITRKEKEPSERSSEQAAEPNAARNDLLFTPQSQMGVYSIGRSNQLIARAFQSDIEKLKKLVETLDIYIEPSTKNYHFTYIDAADVYKGLERILDISGSSGNYSRSSEQSRPNDNRTSGILLIEKTNSILLTGQPSVHRIMASIAESTDVPGMYETGMIRIYKLENADVDEVAKTIQELLESSDQQKEISEKAKFSEGAVGSLSKAQAASDATKAQKSSGSAKSQDSGDFAQTEEFVPQVQVRVSVNKSTNSIVVQATARQHRELEKLIKELDQRRKQVLIKAMIVEVTTSDNTDLGVELNHINAENLFFTSFGLSKGPDSSTGAREIIVSPGGTAAVMQPDKIQAILHALQSSGNAKVTSSPQILVNDNAVGYINAIAEEPIMQVNASQTVATTSFGGFVEAGTKFAITPHISKSDYLRVEYQISLNSFGTKPTDASIPPPRNTSVIQSEATVPDGFTIVVGGLQTTNKSENIDKVPLIGDIPIIGLAFKNTSVKKQYKTTYLFITPVIMKSIDFADLKNVSRKAVEETKPDGNSPNIPYTGTKAAD